MNGINNRDDQGVILDAVHGRPLPYPIRTMQDEQAAYYNRLRKLREAALSEEEHRLVPINPTPSRNIKISAGEISISLPDDATPEQLSAILGVLKSC